MAQLSDLLDKISTYFATKGRDVWARFKKLSMTVWKDIIVPHKKKIIFVALVVGYWFGMRTGVIEGGLVQLLALARASRAWFNVVLLTPILIPVMIASIISQLLGELAPEYSDSKDEPSRISELFKMIEKFFKDNIML